MSKKYCCARLEQVLKQQPTCLYEDSSGYWLKTGDDMDPDSIISISNCPFCGKRLEDKPRFVEITAHEIIGAVDINDNMAQGKCPRCAVKLVDGQCMISTLNVGIPDFIGQDPNDLRGQTLSAGGPGKLVDCWKCPECGFSIAKENKTYICRKER